MILTPTAVEQLAIQQQIELLQQQQQQLQATQQQYVNMGIPLAPGGAFNLQPPMANLSPQTAFQFPTQIQQHNVAMAPPTQPLSHRRNQSAIPSMGLGPPPAPSSGASGAAFGNFENQPTHNRDNIPSRGGRGGGSGSGNHHVRRHSLVLSDAKKAAEIAQQKRTTTSFQFPGPGASGGGDRPEDEGRGTTQTNADTQIAQGSTIRGGRGGAHGRSQSMAVGANGRGGGLGRGMGRLPGASISF